MNDDIQQERRVRQQHRTESLNNAEWRHFNETLRVSVTGGDYTATINVYSIDYIHYLQKQSITATT